MIIDVPDDALLGAVDDDEDVLAAPRVLDRAGEALLRQLQDAPDLVAVGRAGSPCSGGGPRRAAGLRRLRPHRESRKRTAWPGVVLSRAPVGLARALAVCCLHCARDNGMRRARFFARWARGAAAIVGLHLALAGCGADSFAGTAPRELTDAGGAVDSGVAIDRVQSDRSPAQSTRAPPLRSSPSARTGRSSRSWRPSSRRASTSRTPCGRVWAAQAPSTWPRRSSPTTPSLGSRCKARCARPPSPPPRAASTGRSPQEAQGVSQALAAEHAPALDATYIDEEVMAHLRAHRAHRSAPGSERPRPAHRGPPCPRALSRGPARPGCRPGSVRARRSLRGRPEGLRQLAPLQPRPTPRHILQGICGRAAARDRASARPTC